MKLVVASANPAKVEELRQILSSTMPDVSIVLRPDGLADVVEDDDTLVGNARLKARAVMEAGGQPAIADDSGLFVEGLGGEPGVRSARFAGEGATDAQNRAKLLRELVVGASRRAEFRTVIVVAFPDGREVVVEGSIAGTITREERGQGGFGYDRVFVPDEGDGRTFAEMTADEKHAISHRGRALRALRDAL